MRYGADQQAWGTGAGEILRSRYALYHLRYRGGVFVSLGGGVSSTRSTRLDSRAGVLGDPGGWLSLRLAAWRSGVGLGAWRGGETHERCIYYQRQAAATIWLGHSSAACHPRGRHAGRTVCCLARYYAISAR